MSFLQLVLSLDKTIEGNNSILENMSIWPISQQLFGYIWYPPQDRAFSRTFLDFRIADTEFPSPQPAIRPSHREFKTVFGQYQINSSTHPKIKRSDQQWWIRAGRTSHPLGTPTLNFANYQKIPLNREIFRQQEYIIYIFSNHAKKKKKNMMWPFPIPWSCYFWPIKCHWIKARKKAGNLGRTLGNFWLVRNCPKWKRGTINKLVFCCRSRYRFMTTHIFVKSREFLRVPTEFKKF